jgi:hypothetical protein
MMRRVAFAVVSQLSDSHRHYFTSRLYGSRQLSSLHCDSYDQAAVSSFLRDAVQPETPALAEVFLKKEWENGAR